jgi:alkanesulfonate monooxygenase SsuD/methylene tetrahydromethanopterin reductase-like flavin-dependent oxidoreductase (luciferase family)
VRIGITLPTFSPDAHGVIDTARAAEQSGLHGVFVFDHLWPMGDPSRPAMSVHPTVAAVLVSTEQICVGTLVSRIGLLPEEVVTASLLGLHHIGGDRFIAAVGTGDRASADENERLGVPYEGSERRQASLRRVTGQLRDAGVETWIGGGEPATNDVARDTGATLNLWAATPQRLLAEKDLGATVSWAGPLPKDRTKAAETLRAVYEAGATWAVWGWPASLDTVVEVVTAAGLGLARTAK